MPLILSRGSELRTFRRCRLKWHWNYQKRLDPKRKKGALTFGTLVHKALEVYYPPGRERGPHPAETFEGLFVDNVEQFDQWDEEGNKIDALELGVAMLQGYVKRWGEDDYIEIIAPEQPFEIDVYDENDNYLVTFVGIFDTIALSHKTGRVFILEHKTAKSIKDVRINSGYGDQGLGYCWAANYWLRDNGVLKKRESVDGVMFNFLRKALPSDKPLDKMGRVLNKPKKERLMLECASIGISVVNPRTVEGATRALKEYGYDDYQIAQLGEVSKVQAPPLFQRQELIIDESTLATFEKRIRKQAFDMQKVREKRLPIYKNPTMDCEWDCPFVNACELHEMGGDWQSMLDLEFSKWEPYEFHELEEELKS
jgi:hypothetical protein